MIAAFLSPYAFRGLPAPYLWVFYRLLHSIDEPMTFLLSSDYLESPSLLQASGRSEFEPERQLALGYSVPEVATLERHKFCLMNQELMGELLPRYGGNPLAFFRDFLVSDIPELRAELQSHLQELPVVPEVILSWTNCPSLAAAAAACGTRVVHLEVGPLRKPLYRSTAYFDFQGVNGNTEAAARYATLLDEDLPSEISLESVRRSMSVGDVALDSSMRRGGVGVVLQVEDDSNLLSYSNGYDNSSLLARALYEFGGEQVQVRKHPGSRFELVDPQLNVDSSPNSAVFVQRCDKLLIINSSVGLEALLYGVPVALLGNSSYAFIAEAGDDHERLRRLVFYLFAYLVPFDEIFNAEYIRFRLAAPDEKAIMAKHLAIYSAGRVVCGGAEGVRSFVNDNDVVRLMLNRYAEVDANQEQSSKLYFRSDNQPFSEKQSLTAIPFRRGPERILRFKLPGGVRPAAIRIDPAALNGVYIFTHVKWGVVRAEENLGFAPSLNGLNDLDRRFIGCGEYRLSEPSEVPIRVLATGNDPFLELAVGDLFGDVENDERSAVLEISFQVSGGQYESLLWLSRLSEQLRRLEDRSEGELELIRDAVLKIQAGLYQFDETSVGNGSLLRAMQKEISLIVASLQREQ